MAFYLVSSSDFLEVNCIKFIDFCKTATAFIKFRIRQILVYFVTSTPSLSILTNKASPGSTSPFNNSLATAVSTFR